MERIKIIDEWIAITLEGFYLLDVPHADLDRLDLRRDGVWFSEKAPKAPNPPRLYCHDRYWAQVANRNDCGCAMVFLVRNSYFVVLSAP